VDGVHAAKDGREDCMVVGVDVAVEVGVGGRGGSFGDRCVGGAHAEVRMAFHRHRPGCSCVLGLGLGSDGGGVERVGVCGDRGMDCKGWVDVLAQGYVFRRHG
jgi:hypothetical protein